MSASGEAQPSRGPKGAATRDCWEADTPKPRRSWGCEEADA